MNQNAKAWVAALRSKQYQQGDGQLCEVMPDGSEKHDCLGVACELAVDAGICRKVAGGYRSHEDGFYRLYLPPVVRKWLELRSQSGMFFRQGVPYSLAKMNDCGCSFEEIADLIESEPEGLFL